MYMSRIFHQCHLVGFIKVIFLLLLLFKVINYLFTSKLTKERTSSVIVKHDDICSFVAVSLLLLPSKDRPTFAKAAAVSVI